MAGMGSTGCTSTTKWPLALAVSIIIAVMVAWAQPASHHRHQRREGAHATVHDQHDHHGDRNGLHGDRALEVLVVHDLTERAGVFIDTTVATALSRRG